MYNSNFFLFSFGVIIAVKQQNFQKERTEKLPEENSGQLISAHA